MFRFSPVLDLQTQYPSVIWMHYLSSSLEFQMHLTGYVAWLLGIMFKRFACHATPQFCNNVTATYGQIHIERRHLLITLQ